MSKKYNKDKEKEISFTGADLSGASLSAKDLEVALATGKDIDHIDIPDDTPEERRRKEKELTKKSGKDHCIER